MRRLIVIPLAFIGTLGVAEPAIGRNCSSDERNQADRVLAAIVGNPGQRDGLIALHAPFGLHQSTGDSKGEEVLVQGGYLMAHDDNLRTSIWVSYRLTGSDIHNAAGKDRVNCFRKDHRFGRGQGSSTVDYRELVYDQGHLANDADMKDNLIQQVNTYLMSNMSPQYCRFNRGVWLSLEQLTRTWAKKYGEIHVTSGAIFDWDGVPGRDPDGHVKRMRSNNGRMRVGVPSHFYKVIVRGGDGSHHAIAFLLAHDNEAHGVSWDEVRPAVMDAITPVAQVEARASVRLHPRLGRRSLNQEASAWSFDFGMSNFEASCR